MSRNRQPGFSLVELLVVIGVISLLLAIAIPALSAARDRAVDASCRNNLRQLFQAQQAYAIDYGTFTAVWSDAEPISWRLRLEQRLPGGNALTHCPAADHAESEQFGGVEITKASYGLNGVMQFDRWKFQPQRVPTPANIIAIAEQAPSSLETAMTSDGFGVWANEQHANWFRSPEHEPSLGYRHPGGGGSNVVMMDGHVRALSHEQLYRDAGHWYWFDALANDTAAGAGDDDESSSEALTAGPVPGTVGGDRGSGPRGMPTGPLTAPCGCPIDP